MPLSINVGLSRKASKDYQSTGISINVTAELDPSLLARPQQLQEQIDGLYQQAEQAMARQAERLAGQPAFTRSLSDSRPARYAKGNGNGAATRGNQPMTQSQRRCLANLCKRLNTDPQLQSRDVICVEFDQLTLKQVSALIDHSQCTAPVAGKNGGGVTTPFTLTQTRP